MTSFAINNVGAPIYPIAIGITSDVNVSQNFSQEITTEEIVNTPAFNAVVQTVLQNSENAYKTLPEFTTQDTTRNGESTVTALGNNSYRVDMSWTIENAVIELQAQTQTDLQGQEREDFLQNLSDDAVNAYKAQWGWSDL